MDELRARKAALRRNLLARRDALPPALRADLSRRITARLLEMPALVKARVVLAYASFGSEFDTGAAAAAILAGGKRLALPRVNRHARRLELHFVTELPRDLAPGVWGILEPVPERCPLATLDEVDVVLAPGVAFSPRCERLGYGGGYYDQLLAGRRSGLAALAAAFELQLVPDLPVGPTDAPLDAVITETACYVSPAHAVGEDAEQ